MERDDAAFRPIRSDFEAHDRAMELPIAAVVTELVDILGATTVAVIGGVTETRAVHGWMVDREPQREHPLRFAFQLALMLSSRADRKIAQAWFHGSNPRLGDRAPMMLLRTKNLQDVQGALLEAARSFALRM